MADQQPPEQLTFTGERYVPGVAGEDPQLRSEHLLRYAACEELARGRHVLDVACGAGYGTAMLAATAESVVGVDISAEAVAHATRVYGGVPGATFVLGPATELPCADESVDLVVSFETVEHLTAEDQARFVAEIRRVLRPEGLLVVSTPDLTTYDATLDEPNAFHLHELDEAAFLGLLEPFSVFALYRQAVTTFTALWRGDETAFPLRGESPPDARDAVYLVAVAGREGATDPGVSLAGLWHDPELSHRAVVERLTAWALAADATVAERDATVVRLQDELEERTAWAHGLCAELDELKSSRAVRLGSALRRLGRGRT